MGFTRKNKRHRRQGLNSFDKKVSQTMLSIMGVGVIAFGATGAYAAPTETETLVESQVAETNIIAPKNKLEEPAIEIPSVSAKSLPEESTPKNLKITVVPKPEPKPEPKPVEIKIEENKEETVQASDIDKADELTSMSETQTSFSTQEQDGFIAPLENMNLSSPFGYRIHPIYGTSKLHEGADLSAGCGTPVYASASGKVVQSGLKSSRSGNVVEIEHDGGINTNYYHLSRTLVSNGDVVSQGDLIAEVGSTGASTGCHLHWGMTVNGTKTDPMPYLNE